MLGNQLRKCPPDIGCLLLQDVYERIGIQIVLTLDEFVGSQTFQIKFGQHIALEVLLVVADDAGTGIGASTHVPKTATYWLILIQHSGDFVIQSLRCFRLG